MKKSLAALVLMLSFGLAWAADGPDSNGPLTGKVLETKDVDSYTYLLLQTTDGEVWAAVARVPAKVGDEVTIEDAALMPQFFSKSLNRTFDRIYFGSVVTGGSGSAGAGTAVAGTAGPGTAGAGADMAAMHAASARSTAVADVNVAKATGPNAHTVAEVVSGRAQLNDKPVVVRGKIVKFTADVLGKNWIHLRDGTGSASDGTNDVLVTTLEVAGIGDVVLVKGAVRTDRDLGSGYAYKVLIEEATLQKQAAMN